MLEDKGLFKNPRIGGKAQKSQNHHPRQPHIFMAGQHFFQSCPGAGILRQITVDGIKQQIGVHQNHLRSSNLTAMA